MHSANWDHGVKFTKDSTIAVIGNGSSASAINFLSKLDASANSTNITPVQIVPKLQPLVKQLDTFIRTKTWIALPFTSGKITAQVASLDPNADPTEALGRPETSNPPYSEAERQRFNDDPAYLARYRKEIEHENNGRFTFTTCKDSEGAKAAIPKLAGIMRKRLAKKPELAELLIPEWHVGCRRCEFLALAYRENIADFIGRG